MPSETSLVAIISAVISLGVLMVSIFSARAAARSAAASETSAQAVRESLQRVAFRDLVIAVHRCSAEADRIRSLVQELLSQSRAYDILTNNFGSSDSDRTKKNLDAKLKTADELRKDPDALASQVDSLRDASIEDLTKKVCDIDVAHSRLLVLREGLEREQQEGWTMLQAERNRKAKERND